MTMNAAEREALYAANVEAGRHHLTGSPEKVHDGFTYDELNHAFKLVQGKNHWKDPILALIPVSSQKVTAAAIVFFTATEPKFSSVTGLPTVTVVESVGYRNGPAGP